MNIKDFLNEKAVILGSEATSSEEVIRDLGGKLRDLGYVKDNFVEAALEREAEYADRVTIGGRV